MDTSSPVILDSATKFGRPIELQREFPGFPFDEDGFGRRSDIRSHLDELAARHPEFAEQLLGPPWAADASFPATNSLHRQRNRKPSNDRSSQPDEDTRSQASGSSAASGASAVSSHSSESDKASMDNPQQRNVRSMSAPPENRQQNNHPERFVSRVDITPQGTPQQANQAQQPQQENSQSTNNQPQQQPQSQPQQREKSPGPQKPQQQGNVRQIPIFVEGRDEPVIAKGFERDEPDFPRRQQSPPQFQRPSHFQQRYQRSPDWASQYMDPFFEQSTGRWPPPPPPPQSQPGFPQFRHPQEKPRSQQTHHPEPPRQTNQQQKPQAQSQHKQQTQNEAQTEPPKPKPQIQPKDPLEKVAMVQKEVDALTEQVRQYSGNSRQDKHYMYLDEMLTRELIKLDDIDTEGKDNVRQARKQAIKSIQESISLLESKAPLPGQEQSQHQEEVQRPASVDERKEEEKKDTNEEITSQSAKEEDKPAEKMETAEIAVVEEQKAAIPLPAPSSLTNPSPVEPAAAAEAAAAATGTGGAAAAAETSATAATAPSEPAAQSEISQTAAPEAPAAAPVETQPKAPEASREPMETAPVEQPKETKPKKEPPPVPAKPKKAKKTKKPPAPVSENAIPLPAPGQSI